MLVVHALDILSLSVPESSWYSLQNCGKEVQVGRLPNILKGVRICDLTIRHIVGMNRTDTSMEGCN